MKKTEKNKAIKLRRLGESISEIAKRLSVSKASVSVWVRDIKLTSSQRKQLNVRGFSIDAIEKRRISRIQNTLRRKEQVMIEAEKDINSISMSELKIIGSMLYWAEGRKRGKQIIGFSNSDPDMIKIMMKFLRKVCKVPEEKFRGHIHTHSHLLAKKSERYWSGISDIPLNQFFKTYSKPSISSQGKMDKLPYGTFEINVCDTGLFLTIMGWIRKIIKLNSLIKR